MIELILQIAAIIFLLIVSAFFSSAETALTTVSRIKLRTAKEAGDRRAEKALLITDGETRMKSKMMSAILIGNNIANISASSIATSAAIKLFGSYGAGIATGILTLLILVFGEITPKHSAVIRSTEISLKDAYPIWMLMVVFTPLIIIINSLTIFILRITGVSREDSKDTLTMDELRTLVDYSEENGVIEQTEKNYIHNLFDFSDSMVKEIMVPRIDITAVDVNWSYSKLIRTFEKARKTRMPVCEGDTDHIIGILNIKDLIHFRTNEAFSVRKLMYEPYFTYEQKNTADLFSEMRQNSISMAIILDEYGAVAGLITLEDLLEELVGEIRDEYDSNEEDDIIQISDREFVAQGSANLYDLCEKLPLDFESEDYDTLGGYLTGLLDHLPRAGEIYVTESGVILSVAKVGRRRIEKIRIKFPEPVELESDEIAENNDNPDVVDEKDIE